MKIAREFAQELVSLSHQEKQTFVKGFKILRVATVVAVITSAILAGMFFGFIATPALMVFGYVSLESFWIVNNAINMADSSCKVRGSLRILGSCLSNSYATETLFKNAPVARLILENLGEP